MKYLALIFLFLFALNLSASEIKSSVQLYPNAHEYHEGDLVELDIKIWPIENADLEEFKKIEGTSLFGGLEVSQINTLETSENNADVVIIKATAVVVGQSTGSSIVHYKENAVNLSIPQYKIIPLKTKQDDFYILDQSLGSNTLIIWVLGIATLVGMSIYVFQKKFKKTKDVNSEPKKFYQELFSNADARKDFEELYSRKKEWLPLLAAETNAHREFYKLMEMHQYRKEWSPDVTLEIKNSFDIIRGSFE